MKKINLVFLVLLCSLCFLFFGACHTEQEIPAGPTATSTYTPTPTASPPPDEIQLSLDANTTYQTIDGFGTSVMHWLADQYANEAYRTAYAQDLGCSIIRGNLHCSAITGEESMNGNKTTFGSDIDKNAALMDFSVNRVATTGGFMEAVYAQRLDEMKITFSIWTPPHWMKENAILDAEKENQSFKGNLVRSDEMRTQYARYVAAWIKGFSETYNVPVYSLSVQNELNYAHEPSSWTTSCVYRAKTALNENDFNPVINHFYAEFQANNLDVLLMGPETSHIFKHQMDNHMNFVNDILEDPLTKSQLDILCYHGYGISPGDRYNTWKYYNSIKDSGMRSWQTEAGGGPSGEWQSAIDNARTIQDQLIGLNLSGYIYWTYVHDKDKESSLIVNTHQVTGKYHMFKHFSRYIRPGALRIECLGDDAERLAASAYAHQENKSLCAVLVNHKGPANITMELPQDSQISEYMIYTSIDDDYFQEESVVADAGQLQFYSPASSIITVYGEMP